jgi:hypothetical protein
MYTYSGCSVQRYFRGHESVEGVECIFHKNKRLFDQKILDHGNNPLNYFHFQESNDQAMCSRTEEKAKALTSFFLYLDKDFGDMH